MDIPKYGCLNVHPSLLPKYRGPSPIQYAILNGDEKTGVSLFLIDKKMDNGPILSRRELKSPILNSKFLILSNELAKIGADLLIETLPKYINGEIIPLPQNNSQATYTKKIKTEDAFIDLAALQLAMQGEPRPAGREKAIEMERKIRALNPEPGTWTLQQVQGKPMRMKILEAELTADWKLKLKKIQYEGKKPVEV